MCTFQDPPQKALLYIFFREERRTQKTKPIRAIQKFRHARKRYLETILGHPICPEWMMHVDVNDMISPTLAWTEASSFTDFGPWLSCGHCPRSARKLWTKENKHIFPDRYIWICLESTCLGNECLFCINSWWICLGNVYPFAGNFFFFLSPIKHRKHNQKTVAPVRNLPKIPRNSHCWTRPSIPPAPLPKLHRGPRYDPHGGRNHVSSVHLSQQMGG